MMLAFVKQAQQLNRLSISCPNTLFTYIGIVLFV